MTDFPIYTDRLLASDKVRFILLTCTECGAAQEVVGVNLDDVLTHAILHGWSVKDAQLGPNRTVRLTDVFNEDADGLCPKCEAKRG